MLCFTGRHVLLEGMLFLRVCFIVEHVLQFKMPCILQGVCLVVSHVLCESMPYRRIYLVGVHVV